MSSSGAGGSGSPEEKRQSFTKFIRRASTVLKRGSSKNFSPTAASDAQGITGSSSSSAQIVLVSNIPQPATETSTETRPTVSVPSAVAQSIQDINESSNMEGLQKTEVKYPSAKEQQEKVRALFDKYGMTLEPGEWTTPARNTAHWIEKPVRMRVHRQCHQCRAPFGREKDCSVCSHTRCTLCPRIPVRKLKDGAGGGKVKGPPSAFGQQEKARILFAKYGMTFQASDWILPAQSKVVWMEKPIRMRVHHQCHNCQAPFGPERICLNCQHRRCSECPRHPVRKIQEARSVSQAGAMGTAIQGIGGPNPTMKINTRSIPITKPTGIPGKELVRREPVQRVRRTCHKCYTVFIGKETRCHSCDHERCNKCPRDPPKLHKYPNGYPGDVEETFPLAERQFKPPRRRVKWQCHSCSAMFVEYNKICASCRHERCSDCIRHPPKKTKAEPDQAVVDRVEEMLRTLTVTSGPTAA